MILKFASRLAGLLLTAIVLLAAADILLDRAGERFDESGSYSSDLLSWEQEYTDRGTLTVFGKAFEIDLESMRTWNDRAKKGLGRLFSGFREHLTPESEAETQSSTSE